MGGIRGERGRWRRAGFAAAAVAMLLVAACGDDVDASSADGASSGDDAATSDDPDGGGELSGDVLFWHSFTQGPRAEYMEAKASEFMEAHPDVTVTIETFAWPEFYTKWTTGLASGEVPDLSTALPNHVVEMIEAEALVALDDVVDEIGRNRFAEAALLEGQAEGVSFSVPIYSHAQIMWYRQDLLEEAGLGVPETWDELRTTAEQLTADDNYGLAVPLGTGDMMGTRYLNFYVQSAGETLLNEDGTANLTSNSALDGIAYWVDLYRSLSPEGSLNYGVLDQATLFYQGETAFDFNSGFHISGVEGARPELLDDIAAAPLPRLSPGDPIYGGETSNIPMVVWEASENQEAAKAFLGTLFDDEGYIQFLHSVPGGMLPALSDIADDPRYRENETLERFAESVTVIEEAVPMGTAIGMERGPTVQSGIITSQAVIEGMFHDIILNDTDIEEAARSAEEELNSLFASAGAALD